MQNEDQDFNTRSCYNGRAEGGKGLYLTLPEPQTRALLKPPLVERKRLNYHFYALIIDVSV